VRNILLPLVWLTADFHSLLDPNHFFLPLLGSWFHLDTATGTNGRVWIIAKEVKQTTAIEAADPDGGGMDQRAIEKFINTLEISQIGILTRRR